MQDKQKAEELKRIVLQETAKALTDAEALRRCLNIQSRFLDLDAGNTFLVVQQKPDATEVRTSSQWKHFDVKMSPKAREKIAIHILLPDGSVGAVYDIKDMPVEPHVAPDGVEEPTLNQLNSWNDALLSSLEELHISVQETDGYGPVAYINNKKIFRLTDQSNRSPQKRFHDFCQQVSNAWISSLWADVLNPDGTRKEFRHQDTVEETICIEYFLRSQLGLETTYIELKGIPEKYPPTESEEEFLNMLNEAKDIAKKLLNYLKGGEEQ